MCRDRRGLEIVFSDRFFEFAAPLRRAFGHGMSFYRAAIGVPKRDIAAANEAETGMVEVVAIELVDRHSEGARADERVYDFVVKEHIDAGDNLIGVVLSDNALSSLGIVGRSDA